jgi:hypothetical protein
MRRLIVPLALIASFAACSSEEDQLENSIRENLASRGNVQDVQLTRQNDNHMTGFALVQVNGQATRLNCTADRDNGQGSNFHWRCIPTIDDALLRSTENEIRQSLSAQGTVEAVHMAKQDEDHMTGSATVRDSAGNEIHATCSAARAGDQGTFNWRCGPAEEQSAGAAPASDEATGDEGEPVPAEAQPADAEGGK